MAIKLQDLVSELKLENKSFLSSANLASLAVGALTASIAAVGLITKKAIDATFEFPSVTILVRQLPPII